jgi:uncharacterized membrane protein YfcA
VTLLALDRIRPGPQLDHLIQMVLSAAIIVTATSTLLQDPIGRAMERRGIVVGENALARMQRPLTVVAGLLIGTLVTISSVGAGVIGMMILLLLYPRHQPLTLVGSDLAHAVLITGIAGLGHAGIGSVDYRMLGLLLTGALPGIWFGTRLGFRLSPKLLKRVVAGFLVFIGATMAAKAWALAR